MRERVFERPTSCQCSVCGIPPCSWCEEDARECPGCGKLFDRLDVKESGYCIPCERDRFVEHAILSAGVAPEISHEMLAMFGLDD